MNFDLDNLPEDIPDDFDGDIAGLIDQHMGGFTELMQMFHDDGDFFGNMMDTVQEMFMNMGDDMDYMDDDDYSDDDEAHYEDERDDWLRRISDAPYTCLKCKADYYFDREEGRCV